jgi:putative tryptophan/tyrosine transport system substrate-binding protein
VRKRNPTAGVPGAMQHERSCTASGTRGFDRRAIIAFLGGAAACASPLTARTQERMRRIGVLFPAGESPGSRELAQAMAKLGYVEGRNITYVVRAAGSEPERLPQLARELVAAKPDVIVSAAAISARALTEATRDIPIVMALIGDPVALGFSTSMARPTGNVTGFTTGNDTVAAKRLELLLEIVPAARKVAFLWVPTNVQHKLVEERTRQAAAEIGIEILSLPVTEAEDISPAIARAETERAAGLLVVADPLTVRNRRTIIDESVLRDLPAMHNYSFEVRDGALMAYGSDVGEDYGRAAAYVDRILKGAKVAELPFQEPTQVSLAINLRTARSMGLTVPPSLLVRADEVVE